MERYQQQFQSTTTATVGILTAIDSNVERENLIKELEHQIEIETSIVDAGRRLSQAGGSSPQRRSWKSGVEKEVDASGTKLAQLRAELERVRAVSCVLIFYIYVYIYIYIFTSYVVYGGRVMVVMWWRWSHPLVHYTK
jgi:hypothetical protein